MPFISTAKARTENKHSHIETRQVRPDPAVVHGWPGTEARPAISGQELLRRPGDWPRVARLRCIARSWQPLTMYKEGEPGAPGMSGMQITSIPCPPLSRRCMPRKNNMGGVGGADWGWRSLGRLLTSAPGPHVATDRPCCPRPWLAAWAGAGASSSHRDGRPTGAPDRVQHGEHRSPCQHSVNIEVLALCEHSKPIARGPTRGRSLPLRARPPASARARRRIHLDVWPGAAVVNHRLS